MCELNENMRQHGDNYFLVPNIFDVIKNNFHFFFITSNMFETKKYKIKIIFKKLFKDKLLLACFSLELQRYKK